MNRIVVILFFLVTVVSGQSTKLISGQVTDGYKPLEKAVITNLDSGEDFLTDALGRYTAEAKIGDYLSYSFQGMDSVKIKIEDVTRFLNVKLNNKTNQLKEVTVTGERKTAKEKEIEMMLSPTSVRTAFGYVDPRKSASNIRMINFEDNPYTYFCLTEMLRAKFPELMVFGTCSSYEANVYLRGRGSFNNPQPIIYDVDGQVLTQMPLFLSSAEIKRLALIRDLATRTKYGALGAGGVLVINTFVRTPVLDSAENANGIMDDVTEQSRLLADWDQVNGEPEYLTTLKTASSLNSAQNMYADISKRYQGSPYFFLDTYSYFFENGATDFADRIIKAEYLELSKNNPVLLKALAYVYQGQQRHEKANELFKQTFILRPNYAQSYFDLANSYRDLDMLKSSATMFARYDYLAERNFLELDTVGFTPIFEREMRNLLSLNSDLFSNNLKIDDVARPGKEGETTRLVFEWNDSEAEFNLEFLKESEEYYTWEHNFETSPDVILREKEYGYNVAEYLIDHTSNDKPWQVNIKYLGNKSLTPTYLKVTTYTNYGSTLQDKSVQVYKLTTKNVNQELFTL